MIHNELGWKAQKKMIYTGFRSSLRILFYYNICKI